MKISIVFDTESENYDETEMRTYLNANKLLRTLEDIRSKVKYWEKYDNRESIPAEEIYDTFFNILQENDVSLAEMGY